MVFGAGVTVRGLIVAPVVGFGALLDGVDGRAKPGADAIDGAGGVDREGVAPAEADGAVLLAVGPVAAPLVVGPAEGIVAGTDVSATAGRAVIRMLRPTAATAATDQSERWRMSFLYGCYAGWRANPRSEIAVTPV